METLKAVTLFIRSRQAKNLAPDSIRWYRGILLLFAQSFPRLPSKPEDIEGFLIECRAGDERRHGYYRALRCFYRFLHKRLRVKNPVELLDAPRRSHKEPDFLHPEAINKLLAYPHPSKIKATLLFLVDTGARPGELATLALDNLAETPWGFMAIIKGKTGTRLVPISYETYHALMVNLPLGYTSYRLRRLISKAFEKAGVKGSAINLRHSFGTLWEGDELVLQQIMGHTHLSTTRIYRHLRIRIISEQHHRYSPLKMVQSSSKDMFMV